MDEKEKISEKKQEREESIKLKLVISILSFLTILIAEIYIIMNLGSDVNSITLFAIMSLIAAYFVIDSMMVLNEQKTERLAEQYENISNTQKAAYIVLNNSFEEMNERLTVIEKIVKISTDEIINAQKGTSKVVINRNKDNTEAVLQSYIQLSEQLDKVGEMQEEKLSDLDAISEKTVSDVTKQMELNIQQLIIQMKDMELRLNQAIMQNSKVVVSQAVPMQMPETVMDGLSENIIETESIDLDTISELENTNAFEEEKETENINAFESAIEPENIDAFGTEIEPENIDALETEVEPEHIDAFGTEIEPENIDALETEIESENINVSESEIATEEQNEEAWSDSLMETEESAELKSEEVEDTFEENIAEEQAMEEEAEVAPEIQIEEPMLEIKEHELMPELVVEEPPTDESIPEDITMTQISAEEEEEEPVAEEKPAMPDLSNPNKVMSPDEIAALLENIEEGSVAENAALIANVEDTPVQEQVEEEKPTMPDLSDPNKMMSPDDIAALIANL